MNSWTSESEATFPPPKPKILDETLTVSPLPSPHNLSPVILVMMSPFLQETWWVEASVSCGWVQFLLQSLSCKYQQVWIGIALTSNTTHRAGHFIQVWLYSCLQVLVNSIFQRLSILFGHFTLFIACSIFTDRTSPTESYQALPHIYSSE